MGLNEGEKIKSLLKNQADIYFYEQTDSTNKVAKSLAESGAKHGTAVVAASQTCGRGRGGKSFYSENGGIYLSLILRLPDYDGVTPAAAVAVCEILENLCNVKPQIKWVNDVFVSGKKVCGILTEAKLPSYAVLGVGLNYTQPAGGFPKDIAGVAGALYKEKGNVDKNTLIAAMIDGFLTMDTEHYIEKYRAKCPMVGKEISVIGEGQPRRARVLAVTDNCALRVIFENSEIKELTSGEVSTAC